MSTSLTPAFLKILFSVITSLQQYCCFYVSFEVYIASLAKNNFFISYLITARLQYEYSVKNVLCY